MKQRTLLFEYKVWDESKIWHLYYELDEMMPEPNARDFFKKLEGIEVLRYWIHRYKLKIESQEDVDEMRIKTMKIDVDKEAPEAIIINEESKIIQ